MKKGEEKKKIGKRRERKMKYKRDENFLSWG
jgi:hypothetical protein